MSSKVYYFTYTTPKHNTLKLNSTEYKDKTLQKWRHRHLVEEKANAKTLG